MGLGRFGLVILMMAVTAAATYGGSLIAGVGGAVIGAVSGVGVSTLGEAGRRWLDSQDKRRQLRERVFLPLPRSPVTETMPTPATMLVAEQATVPFIACEREISELTDWCTHWNGDPLRLLIGAGGSGKTRLAREFATRLINWDCNWVRTGEEADALEAVGRHKSLMVVDYAETKSRETLGKLVRNLAWPPDRKNVRVLLIARSDGDWWSELIEKADTIQERFILTRATHMKLAPIGGDGNVTAQHYQAAVEAFGRAFARSTNPAGIPEFSRDATVLTVHISALLAVLGTSGLSSDEYVELLDHEDRYWQRSADACGLNHLSRKARRESVAELTLSGASTIADLAEQLKRVPDLAGAPTAARRAVAQWLQGLYPAEGLDTIGSFRPHLLAEHLAVQELTADKEFNNRVLNYLSKRDAYHAFTVLGYASLSDQQALRLINESIIANPERAILPAILVTVETGALLDATLAAQVKTVSLDTLQLARLSAAIPWKSNSLDRTATVVRRRFIEAGTADLNRITSYTADRAEAQRRQTELMEYVRVNKILQEEGRLLPARIRRQLIKALESQEKALMRLGEPQEAGKISQQIEWVKSQSNLAYKLVQFHLYE